MFMLMGLLFFRPVMAESSGSSLSKVVTDLFMKERSVLHVLKKTEHLRRLRKCLKKYMENIAPLLAPHMPKWAEDFEHDIVVVDLLITKIRVLLRFDNPTPESMKNAWKEFCGFSDDEGEQINEEDLRTKLESILSLLK